MLYNMKKEDKTKTIVLAKLANKQKKKFAIYQIQFTQFHNGWRKTQILKCKETLHKKTLKCLL